MFIPRGKAIYEKLATTYVLVDALVADFCEGGFSGFVEVILRDTDANILIAEGKVVGVLEQRGVTRKSGALNRRNYSKATVNELAARSRYERGRVSVYSCNPDTVMTVAGLAGAEQLYAQLSTEFADIGKMINKLSRERDRQWFIELSIGDGTNALIHLKDNRCRLISSHRDTGQQESESTGPTNNPLLASLLESCSQVGGVFDVYFRGVHEEIAPIEFTVPAVMANLAQVSPPFPSVASQQVEAAPEKAARAAAESRTPGVPERDTIQQPVYEEPHLLPFEPAIASAADPIPPSVHELAEARLAALSRAAGTDEVRAKPAGSAESEWQPVAPEEPVSGLATAEREVSEHPTRVEVETHTGDEAEDTGGGAGAVEEIPSSSEPVADQQLPYPARVTAAEGLPRHTTGLSAIRRELESTTDFGELSEAQIMNEVKRLMSEIARTIEESARSIEQRDSFSIYLRAGQLKVAERYPFLDPFGAEFEYLSGEIAFIGSAAPWEFIEGLTEALILAVQGVVQASAQGGRIRAQVTEDLRALLERNKAELIEYGLDGSIEKIIGG